MHDATILTMRIFSLQYHAPPDPYAPQNSACTSKHLVSGVLK